MRLNLRRAPVIPGRRPARSPQHVDHRRALVGRRRDERHHRREHAGDVEQRVLDDRAQGRRGPGRAGRGAAARRVQDREVAHAGGGDGAAQRARAAAAPLRSPCAVCTSGTSRSPATAMPRSARRGGIARAGRLAGPPAVGCGARRPGLRLLEGPAPGRAGLLTGRGDRAVRVLAGRRHQLDAALPGEEAVGQPGDRGPDERGEPEQPKLAQRPAADEDRLAGRPRRVHRRVVHRDADQVDQR